MPPDATFETFEKELNRLVESFGKRLAELKQPGYAEAQLRDDFLNPFFRALGWDMENRAGLIQKEREVEIESATQIGGGRKRADYLFRTDKRDRFVCEAKKPAEELHARYAFQAKRWPIKTPTAFRPPAQGCPRPAGNPGYTRSISPQPQRGCVRFPAPNRRNPVGVENQFESCSQGSRVAPTLGWMTLPRWGKLACV